MAPKVVPGTTFIEISETLIFDESTMIFIVFRVPRGSGAPQNRKKIIKKLCCEQKMAKVDQMRRTWTESGHQGAHRAERKRKGAPQGRPGGPVKPDRWITGLPDAVGR